MIELAPNSKMGLHLASPLIAGSGAVGFGDAWPPGVKPEMFGAMVTAPISLRPRRGLPPPRLAEIPGGYLLATGDHNPGYARVIRDHTAGWRRLGIPVIAALASTTPEDWPRLAGHLEEETTIAGLELVLPGEATPSDTTAWISAVRRVTMLPLLVKPPSASAHELAGTCAEAGSDALVLGTPPLAAYPVGSGTAIEAPVGGPVALPFTLRALRSLIEMGLGLPLIASGGVYSMEDMRYCLAEGAVAVEVRGLLWSDPATVCRLAATLRAEAGQ